jgi:hypothetical protein
MLRTVAGILGGYAVIALFIMASFTLLWLGLGQERAFLPGTTRVSGAWLLASMPLNLLAAIIGGWVAARIAHHKPQVAVSGLIVVLLLLGFASAVSLGISVQGDAPPPPPPASGLGPMEAATAAIQPLWVAWVLPVLGAVGVWIGGSLRMLQASRAPTS